MVSRKAICGAIFCSRWRHAAWRCCISAFRGGRLVLWSGSSSRSACRIGFAARLAFPVYKPRTFLSPGYQDPLGWGFATALGAQHARPDVPVVAISGDGGFLFTATEMATAIRHRIPLTTIVFNDGAFGNVRRIQQERFGNRLIASDLANPDFVAFAESFGAAAERARGADELRGALRRAFARRDGPTLIEVPVGAFPSPWEFIQMPKVRGA